MHPEGHFLAIEANGLLDMVLAALAQTQVESGSSGLETTTVAGVAVAITILTISMGFIVGMRRTKGRNRQQGISKSEATPDARDGSDTTSGTGGPASEQAPGAASATDDSAGFGTSGPVTESETSSDSTAGSGPDVGSKTTVDDRATAGAGGSAEQPAPGELEQEALRQGAVGRSPQTTPGAPDLAVQYDDLTDEEPVGSGGNADVTRATLPQPDGDVTLAIKTPRVNGTLHAESVERMLEEAETWDKLDDHNHVVGVVDYGSQPMPWIAMEYMDGGHLGERAGDLPVEQALWTAISVTKAVRHAHRRGVAHLDLKPENVLFREVGDAWDVPKVADWGLSKHLLEHSATVEGVTPDYAAPEQFDRMRGAPDDVTDVYQVGAVCYELFTGRPPFEGTATEVMRAVMDYEPRPPSGITDVPEGLDDVLLTALEKDRSERYESTLYLRDALQDLLPDS